MCVCFRGRGRNPCWKHIQNTSCKEQPGVFKLFLSWLSGGEYRALSKHSTDPILQFQFFVPSSYCQSLVSVFGKRWNYISVKRPAKDIACLLFLSIFGRAFLVLLSLGFGQGTQAAGWEGAWTGWAPWSLNTRSTLMGNSRLSLWAVTPLRNREGQTQWANSHICLLFSWGGGCIKNK